MPSELDQKVEELRRRVQFAKRDLEALRARVRSGYRRRSSASAMGAE